MEKPPYNSDSFDYFIVAIILLLIVYGYLAQAG